MSEIKKIFSFFAVLMLILSLCGCGKKPYILLPESETFYIDGEIKNEILYTYNGKFITERNTVDRQNDAASFTDYFSVKDYEYTALTRVTYDSADYYTAEKITDNKYLFKDKNGDLFLTMLFDNEGRIISEAYTNGAKEEKLYTFDKKGAAVSLKTNSVRQSGSSKITEFTADRRTKVLYRFFPNDRAGAYLQTEFLLIEPEE